MATGLKVPVGVDHRGRADVETNEVKNTKKILKLALSEGGDDNPFQQLGIDGRLIFGIKNAAFRGKAIQAVQRVASRLDQLIRIDENTIEFDDSRPGEITLSFKYIDLLTQEEQEFVESLVG